MEYIRRVKSQGGIIQTKCSGSGRERLSLYYVREFIKMLRNNIVIFLFFYFHFNFMTIVINWVV